MGDGCDRSVYAADGHLFILAATEPDGTEPKIEYYSLVFGDEAVLPWRSKSLRYGLPSRNLSPMRTKAQIRLVELETLDEKRLQAQQHLEVYQAHIANAYNKMVRLRSFKKGDLVLMVRMNIVITRRARGKF